VSEVDFTQAWKDDANAGVVVAYLESVAHGHAFVEAAAELVDLKPFVVVKSGGSEAGARAVSSHTGSLAGSEAAYDAAFRRAGIIRAHTVQELFDYAVAFSRQPLPEGEGVAILTNAGGPAIMATDACERLGVHLASLDSETVNALHESLPPAAALYNPVDVLGDADATRYRDAARLLADDHNVRALIVMLTPQAMTDMEGTAAAVAEVAASSGKTTLACFMGEVAVKPAWEVLRRSGVPNYPFPERAVAALGAMQRYRMHRARPKPKPTELAVDEKAAAAVIEPAVAAGRAFVTEAAAAKVAAAYGIATPRGGLAPNLASAKLMADDLGYPLVMKIASPDILHKSDVGGIRLGIEDAGQLVDAYEDIMASVRNRMPDAQVWGVELQQMITGGTEVIVGINRDPTFGPLLLFGLGGIYVEILKDVSFRLCPVTSDEAREMISEIRSVGLLRGARGRAPADIEAIADVLVRVSRLAVDFPEILELDVNPLIVRERGQGAIAADIRIGIGGT
jgi:acetyltransferase